MTFATEPSAWFGAYGVATAFVVVGLFLLEYAGVFGRSWWVDNDFVRACAVVASVPLFIVGFGLAIFVTYNIIGLGAGYVEPMTTP